jgi:glucose/arabinose dehydrogenase
MVVRVARASILLVAIAIATSGCPSRSPDDASADIAERDARTDASPRAWCDLPGDEPSGVVVPPGFCARVFAHVQHARVIRFAPGGELFVASPNRDTAGYGGAGPDAPRIAIVPDDDGDGRGDTVLTFVADAFAAHALLFTEDSLYYSLGTQILRMPNRAGQRTAEPATVVANLTDAQSFLHWPHTIDRADDGTIYVSRGGDEQMNCPTPRATRGAIVALDGTLQGRVVMRGLRNPMYLRCHRGFGHCYANELTGDFWDDVGGTEKLVPIRDGDDWGYPCCIERGRSIPEASPPADCSFVPDPTWSIPLHDTPFGLDWEPSRWPAPWNGRLFIALHGQFNTWHGARITAVASDATTGAPMANPAPLEFAWGWDDGSLAHGRPADVAFSPDGRLFVANDITGEIVWMAPR